jgi:hypothetical protein
MGCNCATQEQIKKLHEIYGEKKDIKNIPFEQKIEFFIKNIGVYLVMLFIIPILILFVLYKVLFTKDKKISVKKLLKFNSKGVDEAIAKNIIEYTNLTNE